MASFHVEILMQAPLETRARTHRHRHTAHSTQNTSFATMNYMPAWLKVNTNSFFAILESRGRPVRIHMCTHTHTHTCTCTHSFLAVMLKWSTHSLSLASECMLDTYTFQAYQTASAAFWNKVSQSVPDADETPDAWMNYRICMKLNAGQSVMPE